LVFFRNFPLFLSSLSPFFTQLKEEGKGIILVTHDFGVVAEVADRVLVLKEGEVVEEGDVVSIFDAPKSPYTKALLSATYLKA